MAYGPSVRSILASSTTGSPGQRVQFVLSRPVYGTPAGPRIYDLPPLRVRDAAYKRDPCAANARGTHRRRISAFSRKPRRLHS